jgi:hypothetical protein
MARANNDSEIWQFFLIVLNQKGQLTPERNIKQSSRYGQTEYYLN